MRIFIISHTFSGDGSSLVLLETCSHLIREYGWRIDAIVPPNLPSNSSQALANSGVYPILRGDFDDYDLGIVNCLVNAMFLDQIPRSMPTILWAHEAETALAFLRKGGEEWCKRLQKASCIIFQTPWQSKVFFSYIDPMLHERIYILPNPIPTSSIMGDASSSLNNSVNIVSVGKLTPLKRQQDLIEAVVHLSNFYPVHCNLIGGLEYLSFIPPASRDLLLKYSYLFTLSGELSRKETLKYISVADIFCFPSASESFGLAPLEAGMLKKPVILRNLEVYQYIGWRHGENCLFFDDVGEQTLVECIKTFILDNEIRKNLAEGAFNLATNFSKNSGQFFKEFRQLCLRISKS